MAFKTYRARGGRQFLAEERAAVAAAAAASPFTIEVRFVGGLTPAQEAAFQKAADRWSRVIVGDLPPVNADGELIDDVLILAQGADIDGVGKILGQAGPTMLRPASAGASAFLPAKGEMTFDSADLADMEANGTLQDVITHEMGHVLGIGTVWNRKHLLKGAGGSNPTFIGKGAMAEYGKLVAGSGPRPVPVENNGGPGTRDSHWRETVFGNELMTGFVAQALNPLSRITVASLHDLGYAVDFSAAEAYALPTAHLLAEAGISAAGLLTSGGVVLPRIPTVLADDSLRV